jgi:hypothetical protein
MCITFIYSGVDQKNSGVGRAHLPPPLCYALDNWLPTKITYTVKRIRISPSPTLNIYLFEGPIDICQLYYKKKFVFEKH